MAVDWKAFLDPKLVFAHPFRSIGILCASVGIFTAPLDAENRWLAFGFFLIFISLSGQKWRLSIQRMFDGNRTRTYLHFRNLFAGVIYSLLAIAMALVVLHQSKLTPRLDAWMAGLVKRANL